MLFNEYVVTFFFLRLCVFICIIMLRKSIAFYYLTIYYFTFVF